MRPHNPNAGDPQGPEITGPDDATVSQVRAAGDEPERTSPHPVRARRLELGFTQEQAAELANIPLATFKRWDRGEKRPRHAERATALATALQTTVEELWGPPEPAMNPQTSAYSAPSSPTPERSVPAPPTVLQTTGEELWGSPEPAGNPQNAADSAPSPARPERPVPALPTVTEVLQTLDEASESGLLRQRFYAQTGSARAVGIGIAVAAMLITALYLSLARTPHAGNQRASASTDRRPALPISGAARPSATASEAVRNAELQVAIHRRDYDRAIALAKAAGHTAAESSLRRRAAATLVRRAGRAADRGDIGVARSRLQRARERYDIAPSASKVAKQIRSVLRRRAERRALRVRRARGPAARPGPPARVVAVPAPVPTVPQSVPADRGTAATPPAGSAGVPRKPAPPARRATASAGTAEREFGP